MTSRFTQLPNNGWKLTNELGYILQDRALSVVQARKVVNCTDCLCPSEQTACLRVPCNLVQSQCQYVTLPLFDAETRAPFKIKAGTIINEIVVLKRRGACLDDSLEFALGTICGNDCDSDCDPQRWVSESCPISGAQLNKCGVIKVDVSKKHKDCPVYLCQNQSGCAGQCGPAYSAQSAPCDEGVGEAAVADCEQPECGHDEHGCYATVRDCDTGCAKYCGPCAPFAGGELQDCLIGITLLDGSLGQDDILIAVKSWSQCCTESCADDDVDQCAGVPQFSFPHGGF